MIQDIVEALSKGLSKEIEEYLISRMDIRCQMCGEAYSLKESVLVQSKIVHDYYQDQGMPGSTVIMSCKVAVVCPHCIQYLK